MVDIKNKCLKFNNEINKNTKTYNICASIYNMHIFIGKYKSVIILYNYFAIFKLIKNFWNRTN